MNSDNMNDSQQENNQKDPSLMPENILQSSGNGGSECKESPALERNADSLSEENSGDLQNKASLGEEDSSDSFDELGETTFWELKLPVSTGDDTGVRSDLVPDAFPDLKDPVAASDPDPNARTDAGSEESESQDPSGSIKDHSSTMGPKAVGTEIFPSGRRRTSASSNAKELGAGVGNSTKDIVRDNTEKNGFLGSGSVNKILSNAPSSLNSSITLGNQYRLLERAGKGKMGEVWKAFDMVGNRVVALKFIPRNIEGYKYAVLKAKSTFKATHDLNHQYICPTHSLLEDPDFGYFLVMKWIPENLKETLEDNKKNDPSGRLPDSIIQPIIFDLADALDFLHEHNVIHRDIKPANIAVMRKKDESFESASLIDFGLAVSLDYKGPADSFYQLSGTPSYMPPEQWKNDQQGPRSDQYALAVVAYELFSGHRLFTVKNISDLELHVLYTAPNPIDHVSARINNALLKALSKKPEDRFPTCRAFAEAMFPPKQPITFWKSWVFWALFLAALALPFLFGYPFQKETVLPEHQKLQLYDFVLNPNVRDPLGFTLEKSCQVVPKFRSMEVPSPTSQKSFRIDNKSLSPTENHKEKNWSWTWSEKNKSGTLTLNNYTGGSIIVRGVSVDLVLPDGSKNDVSSPNTDALFVDGNLAIRANARSSLSLSGGLWCRSQFTFTDQAADGKGKPEDRPALSINGKKIDYFVDTAENFKAALKANVLKKTILITKSFQSGPINETLPAEQAGFVVFPRHNVTIFSSGNHRIVKSKETSVFCPLLRVDGTLELGTGDGMGSSTLAFDGGSVFTDDNKTEYPHLYSTKMVCVSTDKSKVFRFYPHVLDQTSKSSLVSVYGLLKFHQGIYFQNNVNINYFDNMSRDIGSTRAHVGGIFVDTTGRLEMSGGSIRNCQGALCGAVNAYGEFIMSGGLIENNCSYNGGNNVVEAGGVRVFGTIFTMSGGEIINNIALANGNLVAANRCAKGGGVHGSFGAMIHLSGGAIRGNISLWAGGGIYMGGRGNSNLTISKDVIISDNAAPLGGGIYSTSNLYASGGRIENNRLIAKVSSMAARGEGIYIKEWNTPETQGRGPVLALSGNVKIDPKNPIFICSNIALGPLPGPCVFIPIQVTGTLTDPEQNFSFNVGTAASINDNSIRLIRFTGKDFNRKKEELASQFAKFHFGYLGFTENTAFELDPVPATDKEKSRNPNISEKDIPSWFMYLKEKKENKKISD